jgi:hypothetical protein
LKKCPYCDQDVLDTALKCIHCGEWIDRYEPSPEAQAIIRDKAINKPTLYFSTTVTKLILLSLSTLGLYHIYWFYRNWKAIEQYQEIKVGCTVRSLMGFVFCFSLFRKIFHSAQLQGYDKRLSPELIALAYFYFAVLFFLADVVQRKVWLLWVFSFLPLLIIQKVILFNNMKVNPGYMMKKGFSLLELIIVVMGGCVFFCLVIGVFL